MSQFRHRDTLLDERSETNYNKEENKLARSKKCLVLSKYNFISNNSKTYLNSQTLLSNNLRDVTNTQLLLVQVHPSFHRIHCRNELGDQKRNDEDEDNEEKCGKMLNAGHFDVLLASSLQFGTFQLLRFKAFVHQTLRIVEVDCAISVAAFPLVQFAR